MMYVCKLSCPGRVYRMTERKLKVLVSGVPTKGIVATTVQSRALTVCSKWICFQRRVPRGT